jgi:hypothetical protein
MGELDCPDCGPTELLAGCDGGSYLLLCAKCRECIVATSWLSIGPEWEGEVEVYRLGDESTPLLGGVGSAIWRDIERLAGDLGEIVIIRSVGTPPA